MFLNYWKFQSTFFQIKKMEKLIINNIDFEVVRIENGDPLIEENGNIYVQRKNGK